MVGANNPETKPQVTSLYDPIIETKVPTTIASLLETLTTPIVAVDGTPTKEAEVADTEANPEKTFTLSGFNIRVVMDTLFPEEDDIFFNWMNQERDALDPKLSGLHTIPDESETISLRYEEGDVVVIYNGSEYTMGNLPVDSWLCFFVKAINEKKITPEDLESGLPISQDEEDSYLAWMEEMRAVLTEGLLATYDQIEDAGESGDHPESEQPATMEQPTHVEEEVPDWLSGTNSDEPLAEDQPDSEVTNQPENSNGIVLYDEQVDSDTDLEITEPEVEQGPVEPEVSYGEWQAFDFKNITEFFKLASVESDDSVIFYGNGDFSAIKSITTPIDSASKVKEELEKIFDLMKISGLDIETWNNLSLAIRTVGDPADRIFAVSLFARKTIRRGPFSKPEVTGMSKQPIHEDFLRVEVVKKGERLSRIIHNFEGLRNSLDSDPASYIKHQLREKGLVAPTFPENLTPSQQLDFLTIALETQKQRFLSLCKPYEYADFQENLNFWKVNRYVFPNNSVEAKKMRKKFVEFAQNNIEKLIDEVIQEIKDQFYEKELDALLNSPDEFVEELLQVFADEKIKINYQYPELIGSRWFGYLSKGDKEKHEAQCVETEEAFWKRIKQEIIDKMKSSSLFDQAKGINKIFLSEWVLNLISVAILRDFEVRSQRFVKRLGDIERDGQSSYSYTVPEPRAFSILLPMEMGKHELLKGKDIPTLIEKTRKAVIDKKLDEEVQLFIRVVSNVHQQINQFPLEFRQSGIEFDTPEFEGWSDEQKKGFWLYINNEVLLQVKALIQKLGITVPDWAEAISTIDPSVSTSIILQNGQVEVQPDERKNISNDDLVELLKNNANIEVVILRGRNGN